jgi:hypothetical protein
MTHALHVRDVIRWTDFNEYEGEVHGELDGVPVHGYVLAAPAEQWDSYRPGASLDVDAWLERSGEVERLPAGSPSGLTHVDGVVYDVAGTVAEVDGEQLQVESTLPIRVDLDRTTGSTLPVVKVGDVVRVRGILKIDLPDEDE